ncbi:hypothetical protein FW320_12680 [Azospirillum sp. Vi22]|uniref:hypothetical protein n=1 Tax=Azospirillum baldaniorum TaxID=1064539 RepID=UPI00157B838B|nr:hypothetical protein [Azospirillum baldaniorum]NUB07026.1 hypothetical protein [Azospirillum baldaniorum]
MSAEQPWLKFFPTDWRADQGLRVVSLAARGLWIECMCIMHEADPYGHLVVNGRPVTDTQLALLTGASPDQLAGLLTELELAGVFSRNSKGVVYSRRMTRDHKKSQTARKNGKTGGNPNLCSEKENSASDKGQVKRRVKGRDNTQRPEARNQNIPPKSPQGGTGNDDVIFAHGKSRSTWRLLLIGYRDNRLWPITAGPQPFEPGCYAPADLVGEILEPEDV